MPPKSNETGVTSSRPATLSCSPATSRWPRTTATFSPTWHGSTACREPRSLHRATTTDGGTASPAIRPLLSASMLAVEGDAVATHGVVVCGTAGDAGHNRSRPRRPSDPRQTAKCIRSTKLLSTAAQMRTSPRTPLYVLWHYPPFDAHSRPGPCVELFEQAGVTACVYGHLHNEGQWSVAVQGIVRGVRYHCVAADAIGFRPLRIGTLSKDCVQA